MHFFFCRVQRKPFGHRAQVREYSDGHIERDRHNSWPLVSRRDQSHHQAQGTSSSSFPTFVTVELLLKNVEMFPQTRRSWSEVFILAAVIHYIGVLFYGIFASGELQPWAEPKVEQDQQMDEVRVHTIDFSVVFE